MTSISDSASFSTSAGLSSKGPPPLIFDRNSVTSATIYQAGSPIYTVVTDKTGSRTDVCDIRAQIIVGTVKKKDILPDTVKFPQRNDGKSITVKSWLRPISLFPHFPEGSISLVTDQGNFVWKTDRNFRLGLYLEDDPAVTVAYMMRTKQDEVLILYLQTGSEAMIEDIVVSFIILEHRLRLKEKRRYNGMLYGPISQDGLS